MKTCPYCNISMQSLGFLESYDELGIYIADTYHCPACDFRLEKEPVYVGDLPDDEDEQSAAR
ncbi:MAG: hypothetical protein K8I82_20125 [Anaerolineae bacterium]|nr:hypothetical protein [Anaerolineae bacterium]